MKKYPAPRLIDWDREAISRLKQLLQEAYSDVGSSAEVVREPAHTRPTKG
jgi:hypothetical protein